MGRVIIPTPSVFIGVGLGTEAELRGLLGEAGRGLIMSVSGWRKVFAEGEESAQGELSLGNELLVACIARSFCVFLQGLRGVAAGHSQEGPCFLLAQDTRPTGTRIADIFIRCAASMALRVRYLGIAASPEIMASVAQSEGVTGFAYISASHNPIGHNGFKFGLANGSVLSSEHMAELRRIFLEVLDSADVLSASTLMDKDAVTATLSKQIYEEQKQHKNAALWHYQKLNEELIGTKNIARIRAQLQEKPLGILAELNGSARSMSIDGNFFAKLGVDIRFLNDVPGQIVHGILPEGENLELCKQELEKLHRHNPAFVLGYVPDNDGDRGNIVYISTKGSAEIVDAQSLFALVTLSEAAMHEYRTEAEPTTASTAQLHPAPATAHAAAAIVVNCATSMRINDIAEYFGYNCQRTEVGEAQLISRSGELQSKGVHVIIAGEGSNGGCILPPSSVRDPLNSISSILKLLCIRDTASPTEQLIPQNDSPSAYTSTKNKNTRPQTKLGLYHRYCLHAGIPYKPNFSLQDIIDSLPSYTTTPASAERACMRIQSTEQAQFKAVYERIFLKEWEERKTELAERWDIYAWQEYNSEGTEDRRGFGSAYRSGAQSGGLKIVFTNADGENIAFVWMRKSGTEAVFRLLADVKGERPELENYLVQWQRSLIEQADTLCTRAK